MCLSARYIPFSVTGCFRVVSARSEVSTRARNKVIFFFFYDPGNIEVLERPGKYSQAIGVQRLVTKEYKAVVNVPNKESMLTKSIKTIKSFD